MAVCALSPAAAQSGLLSILDEPTRKDLAAKGTLFGTVHDGEPLHFIPRAVTSDVLRAEASAFHPTIGAEVLRFFPMSGGGLKTPAGMLSLCNTLASVSTMKGITYWSVTRNKRWPLFTESYAIESPDNPRRIADPFFSSIESQYSIYSFQEDSSFGRNIYRSSFTFVSDQIRTRTENLTPITYILIPIIPVRGLVVDTLIMPTEGGLLFYSVSLLRATIAIGNQSGRADSLVNRMMAMSDWLKGRLAL
jgi:hypothetical protein